MRFGNLFSTIAVCTSLAFSVSGAAIEKRATQDMQAMSEAFDKVFSKIDNMVAVLGQYKGDAATLEAVKTANAGIREAVVQGTKVVKNSPGMGIFSIIHIGGPLMVMEGKVGELMDALKAQRPAVQAANAKLVIYDELKKDKVVVDQLVDSIMRNLPIPDLIGIVARPLGALVIKKLTDGMLEWATS